MADYIYTMETRLTPDQQRGVSLVQETARAHEINVYLTGGAIRDLISGLAIRDLDFTVQGNPAKLQKDLERSGAIIQGEDEGLKAIFVLLPGNVRGEIAMARSETYEKPGKRPEIAPATITDDLRRRDFSVNAMALSLNPGSRGLLLDPTNGVADIEAKLLRVLGNYSFLEDPRVGATVLADIRMEARMSRKLSSVSARARLAWSAASTTRRPASTPASALLQACFMETANCSRATVTLTSSCSCWLVPMPIFSAVSKTWLAFPQISAPARRCRSRMRLRLSSVELSDSTMQARGSSVSVPRTLMSPRASWAATSERSAMPRCNDSCVWRSKPTRAASSETRLTFSAMKAKSS